MCGVGAIASFNESQVAISDLNRILDLLHHRGPDGQGILLSNRKKVGLAHTRLAIRDIANGHQPMVDGDANIAISFNGEIYDIELHRSELVHKGFNFKTKTDTEVLLKLYQCYGLDMFEKINGEYAFVIWDNKRKKLIAGRDPLGIKPLYYYKNDTEIVFASEIKALMALGRLPTDVSKDYLLTSFFGMFVGEESFFNGVKAVKPGHVVVVDGRRVVEKSHWQPRFEPIENLTTNMAAAMLKERLNAAIQKRLVSDVPLGLYLSGGIDSAVVAALASQYKPDIKAFSIGFSGESFDESYAAEKTARDLGIPFELYQTDKSELANHVIDSIFHIEIPIGSPQPVGMYMLSKHIRDAGYKTCLNGDGADELFGGYAYFKQDALRAKLLTGAISKAEYDRRMHDFAVLEKVNKVLLWYPSRKWKQFLLEKNYTSNFYVRYRENESLLKKVFNEEVLSEKDVVNKKLHKRLNSLLAQADTNLNFNRLLSFQQMSGYIFPMQGDRVQMSHSIEGRVPFLDKDVVSLAMGLSHDHLLNVDMLQEKRVLHEVAEGCVPQHMRGAHKKAYHNGYTWRDFRQSLLGRETWNQFMSAASLSDGGIFNPGFMKLVDAVNRMAPRQSVLKYKTDLLLGNVFSAAVLQAQMSQVSIERTVPRSFSVTPEILDCLYAY